MLSVIKSIANLEAMHHYRSLTSRQLAEDEYFQRWVKADGGNAELDEVWRSWIAANADRADVVEEARHILLAVYSDHQYIADPSIKQRTWKRIDDTLSADRVPAASHRGSVTNSESRVRTLDRIPTWFKWAAAASVVLAVSLTYYRTDTSSAGNQRSVVQSINESGQTIKVTEAGSESITLALEDGSSVVLQPHSKLSYPEHFDGRDRKVTLVGEGFFEVSKDKNRPFFVQTSYITTRVVGTSFSVRVFPDDKNATVSVKTGTVSVFRHHAAAVDSAEVMLAPSQQVTYNVSEEKLTKLVVRDEKPLPAVARYNFEFEDTPIRDVFQMMKIAYHVEITYDEVTFSRCLLNAALDDVPFEEKLRLICKAVGATYRLSGNTVIITGDGC